MPSVNRPVRRALPLVAFLTVVAALGGAMASAADRAQESRIAATAVTLSSRAATLELELATGDAHTITLRDGEILIDGEARGSYVEGGPVEAAWKELLRRPELTAGDGAAAILRDWHVEAKGEEAASDLLLTTLADLLGTEAAPVSPGQVREMATVARPDGQEVSIAPGPLSVQELRESFERLRQGVDVLREELDGRAEEFALIVHDDYAVPAGHTVAGGVALLDGTLRVGGTIEGDIVVLGGTLELDESARVSGDVIQLGGGVEEDGGRIAGEIIGLHSADLARRVAEIEQEKAEATGGTTLRIREIPSAGGRRPGFFGRIGRNIGHAIGGLLSVVGWFLGLGLLGVICVYFFQARLETVADTVRQDLFRSFGVGFAGQLLIVPVLLVLIVGIVTWLVIPLYALAVAVAIPAGYLAVAHATGETVALQRYDWVERFRFHRSNSYYYVLSGLGVLLAPFAIGAVLYLLGGLLAFVRGLAFFAGGLLTWFAATAGFGAVILTRGGSRPAWRRRVPVDDTFASAGGFEPGSEASA